ncbi:RUN and SH3 domain containing 1 isoform X2 [Amia ocellicauda]|uniref:RUN and SH3 domain containing 1 isoform X2 n=1 Tax=Amia ocellicauda TaxID=2972642 RepID=UPI0034649772
MFFLLFTSPCALAPPLHPTCHPACLSVCLPVLLSAYLSVRLSVPLDHLCTSPPLLALRSLSPTSLSPSLVSYPLSSLALLPSPPSAVSSRPLSLSFSLRPPLRSPYFLHQRGGLPERRPPSWRVALQSRETLHYPALPTGGRPIHREPDRARVGSRTFKEALRSPDLATGGRQALLPWDPEAPVSWSSDSLTPPQPVPPRLSPVGAYSPPQRDGTPPPGADRGLLCSPLFPRSRTLPSLALGPAPAPQAPGPVPHTPGPPRPVPTRRTLYGQPVRSLSFAGTLQGGGARMLDAGRTPLGDQELTRLCLLEKRGLVSAVSVAVEAVLAQFSSSRTQVQKAQSGDSSMNPPLARVVLQCLCPALRHLLSDGLKPHQSDLIAGRRRNSPWGLVQASTRPDVLAAHYSPASFLSLSRTSCQPLFEELLLLLQPLSLLTFHLDLLFEHHHLDPASPAYQGTLGIVPGEVESHKISKPQPCPANQGSGPRLGMTSQGIGRLHKNGLPEETANCSPVPGALLFRERDIDSESEGAPPSVGRLLSQGWGSLLRWGGRLGQSLKTPELPPQDACLPARPSGSSSDPLGFSAPLCGIAPPGTESRPSEGQPEGSEGIVEAPSAWLGRLFGATRGNGPSHVPPLEPKMARTPARRPSSWLSPGVSTLSWMMTPALSPTPERGSEGEVERGKDRGGGGEKPQALRAVRALCDHQGLGAELSFRKGEELLLVGGVDEEWIRCRQGDREGLVPIGYASLIL